MFLCELQVKMNFANIKGRSFNKCSTFFTDRISFNSTCTLMKIFRANQRRQSTIIQKIFLGVKFFFLKWSSRVQFQPGRHDLYRVSVSHVFRRQRLDIVTIRIFSRYPGCCVGCGWKIRWPVTKLPVCAAAALATALTFGAAHWRRPVVVLLGERDNVSFQDGGLPLELDFQLR